MARKREIRYDMLNVRADLKTLAKAERLARLLSRERGEPVARYLAVDIAISAASDRRKPKG